MSNPSFLSRPNTLLKALLVAGLGTFLSVVAAADKPANIQRMQEAEKGATNIFEAYFPDLATARKAAISFHSELLEANYPAGYLVLELQPAQVQRLRQFGFKFKPATAFMAHRKSVISEMQGEMALREQAAPVDSAAREAASAVAAGVSDRKGTVDPTTIPKFSCYETVEETFRQAQAFASNRPELATWTGVGDSWEKTQALGGFDIGVLKLTNSLVTGSKPKLFVNSAIHAREYTTAPLNLEFARWLVNGYGVNADATWILDHHEVHLMLQTNPDGRKMAEAGLSWRKNTNQAYCGATSNTRGADLNRNFTFSFNSTGGAGSSGDVCNLTYRGASAASEPETQAIEAYVRSLWPDQRGVNLGDAAPRTTSGIHIDLHSYSQLVLWPWGTTSALAGNAADLQTLGRKLAFFNGYSPQQSIGLYPTDGTSDSVSYGELGVAAYTIELGTKFFESCRNYTRTIRPDNLNALIYAAKVVRTPYITPSGPDVASLALAGTASTTGVLQGSNVALTASASDTRYNNSNGVQASQSIAAAEFYLDTPPWVAGAVPVALVAADGSFNNSTEALSGVIATGGLSVGRHTVFVRARDADGNWGPVSAAFLQVVSPVTN